MGYWVKSSHLTNKKAKPKKIYFIADPETGLDPPL